MYYSVVKLQDDTGNLVYIQQKEIDEDSTERVKGSIVLAKEDLHDLIRSLIVSL